MRKFLFGAAAALVAAGAAVAQSTQAPAPVVPLSGGPSAGAVAPVQFNGPGAPVVGLSGGDVLSGAGASLDTSTGGGLRGGRHGYAEASFLLMWVNNSPLSVPTATGGPSLGVVGRPGTTTLLGNTTVDYGSIPGVKVALGGFFGDTSLGFETTFFYLGRESTTDTLGSTAGTVIARPFFDPSTKAENAKVIAAPGAFNGGYVQNLSTFMYGFEANPFFRLSQGSNASFDLITGFRYLQHEETLNIFDGSTLLPGGVTSFNGFGVASPGRIAVNDHFGVKNQFYGGQVGARLSLNSGSLFLDLTGKIAIGGVLQTVSVDGSTTLSGSNFVAPATTNGGFYASGKQLGSRSDSRFAVLPEGNAQLGYHFTSWLNGFAGYQVMYLSSAVRPGDQINRNINLTQLPTSPTYNRTSTVAASNVTDTHLWIHGFNFGVTISY